MSVQKVGQAPHSGGGLRGVGVVSAGQAVLRISMNTPQTHIGTPQTHMDIHMHKWIHTDIHMRICICAHDRQPVSSSNTA